MSSTYEKYIKPRYANDPEFRAKVLAANAMRAEGKRALDPLAYRKQRAEYSKRCYDSHPDYKERKRLYSRAYRLRKLQLDGCSADVTTKSPIPHPGCTSMHPQGACMTPLSCLPEAAHHPATSSQSRYTLPT